MKYATFLALTIGVLAASLFAVRPSVAASENEISVYFQPRSDSGTRQPRTPNTGQLVPFPNSAFPVNPNIDGLQMVDAPVEPPLTKSLGTATFALAYVNVSGGAAGGITVFPGYCCAFVPVPVSNPPQDIVIQNVYLPTTGCPSNMECGTGANIDEYSETEGVFFNDTFVNVFAPPTSTTLSLALTNGGNVNGFVPTDESVRIHALDPPQPFQNEPTAGTFDRWATGPGGTIGANPQDLDVNKLASDYALALYHAACPMGYSWNSSSTISWCAPPNCPILGEIQNPNTKECRCLGEIDPTTKTCVPCPDGVGSINGHCRCVHILPNGQCV